MRLLFPRTAVSFSAGARTGKTTTKIHRLIKRTGQHLQVFLARLRCTRTVLPMNGGACFCPSLVQEWKMTMLFEDLQSLTLFADVSDPSLSSFGPA